MFMGPCPSDAAATSHMTPSSLSRCLTHLKVSKSSPSSRCFSTLSRSSRNLDPLCIPALARRCPIATYSSSVRASNSGILDVRRKEAPQRLAMLLPASVSSGSPTHSASRPETCALYSRVSRRIDAARFTLRCSADANLSVRSSLSSATPLLCISRLRCGSASPGNLSIHSFESRSAGWLIIWVQRSKVRGPSFCRWLKFANTGIS
mmetsp:Transcript_35729/g.81232  ORF Transcript_35729/g.81232 Transcript_35729/m.81232 type:complete len:206 (-) Transcript_35729:819-1436(-)